MHIRRGKIQPQLSPVMESINRIFLSFPNPTKKPIMTPKITFAGPAVKALAMLTLRSGMLIKERILFIVANPIEIMTLKIIPSTGVLNSTLV